MQEERADRTPSEATMKITMIENREVSTRETTANEEKENLRSFFCATREGFTERAGKVAQIRSEDFEDEHKKRHLMSYKESMDTWNNFEHSVIDEVKSNERLLALVKDLYKMDDEIFNADDLNVALKKLRKTHKIAPNKVYLSSAFKLLVHQGEMSRATQEKFESLLIRKHVRTASGVAVITVLTSPGAFSCPKDCYYCPNEPGQPRSYLSTEPAVLRGNQCGWDSARQFWDRARTLHKNGHTIDKLEILVLGGTWSGYSTDYQEEFVRDLFYAANTFNEFLELSENSDSPTAGIPVGLRERKPLEEEQTLNESASCRVIGLTLETRPDYINKYELRRLRKFGCTRVQIGVQHTDEEILQKINRGCTTEKVKKAIRLLKDACFKVDIHLMPDLPGATLAKDSEMFQEVLTSPSLQADQWKIYPCEVTPFTRIAEWYKEGTYIPYTEESEMDLMKLILQVKRLVHPWIRLNRVVRDIPNPSIIAGNSRTNLRQLLDAASAQMGWRCQCMRCREIRQEIRDTNQGKLFVRAYHTDGGMEYFLSFETPDRKTLFAFLRLRLREFSHGDGDTFEPPFAVLRGRCAYIRELHVYGMLVGTQESRKTTDVRYQHTGFGRSLLLAAEGIALCKGYEKMAVISGVGVREYYAKFGYELQETYMVKDLDLSSPVVFEKWRENKFLPAQLAISHYNLSRLPAVTSVPIDDEIVSNVLKSAGVKGKLTKKETKEKAGRKFDTEADMIWTETITLPLQSESLWAKMGVNKWISGQWVNRQWMKENWKPIGLGIASATTVGLLAYRFTKKNQKR